MQTQPHMHRSSPVRHALERGIAAGIVLAILTSLLLWLSGHEAQTGIQISSATVPWIIAIVFIVVTGLWRMLSRRN